MAARLTLNRSASAAPSSCAAPCSSCRTRPEASPFPARTRSALQPATRSKRLARRFSAPSACSFATPKVAVLGLGRPLPPKSVTAAEAATGIYDAQYIEVTGLVTENESKQTPPDLVITSGSQTFRALLPAFANSARAVHLPRNALVRVRGIEAVDPELTQNQTPFILFLPSTDSIDELLADPPVVEPAEHDLDCTHPRDRATAHPADARARASYARAGRDGGTPEIGPRDSRHSLAQSFAGVGYQLQAVRTSLAVGSSSVSEHIDLAIDMVRHSHQEARRSIAAMQPELMEGTKLAAMLEERARHLVKGTPPPHHRQYERRSAPTAAACHRCAFFGLARRQSQMLCDTPPPATLRILVVFHSRAIELVIEDDGKGFNPGEDLPGLGLRSMRKRAEAIGAELLVISRPGCGARVEMRAFLRRKPEIGRQFGKRRQRESHAREN